MMGGGSQAILKSLGLGARRLSSRCRSAPKGSWLVHTGDGYGLAGQTAASRRGPRGQLSEDSLRSQRKFLPIRATIQVGERPCSFDSPAEPLGFAAESCLKPSFLLRREIPSR